MSAHQLPLYYQLLWMPSVIWLLWSRVKLKQTFMYQNVAKPLSLLRIKADIRQHWCVCVWKSTRECRLWVPPYSSGCPQHVLFVILVWFVRWEVSGCTTTVLWGVASRICSEQHIPFLDSSHLAFAACISLSFKWFIDTVVLTQSHLVPLCADIWCNLNEQPGAMNDRDGWQEKFKELHAVRTTW